MISGNCLVNHVPFGQTILPKLPKGCVKHSGPQSHMVDPELLPSREFFNEALRGVLKPVTPANPPPQNFMKLRSCEEGEDELFASDRKIIWSRGDGLGSHVLVKTMCLDDEIEQIDWIDFKSEEKILRSITALTGNNLEIFTEDGQHYPVKKLFRISQIFPTSSGLMVLRSPSEDESFTKVPLPILYTMDHPLDDFHPVVLRSANRLPQGVGYFMLDSKYEIVGVIKELSIVVLYHTVYCVHSFWYMRSVTDEELEVTTRQDSWMPMTDTTFGDSRFHSLSFMSANQSNISSPGLSRSITLNSKSPSFASPLPLRSNNFERNSSPIHFTRRSLIHSAGITTPTSVQTPIERPHTGDTRGTLKSTMTSRAAQPTPRNLELEMSDEVDAPVFPEQTLENLWQEPLLDGNEMASKVLITTDLSSESYLVLLLAKKGLIKLIKVEEESKKNRLCFGSVFTVYGKDVESIPSSNMMIVLDVSDTLVLYSGHQKVTILYLPSVSTPLSNQMKSRFSEQYFTATSSPRTSSLTPTRPRDKSILKPKFPEELISPVVKSDSAILSEKMVDHLRLNTINSIHSSTRDRVMIESHDMKYYRFSLPPLASSVIVNLCLKSFTKLLPKTMSHELLVHWYRSRNSISNFEISDLEELSLFKKCLLSLIGYEVEDISVTQSFLNDSLGVTKKLKPNCEEQATEEDWKWMLESKNEEISDSVGNILIPTTSSLLFGHLPTLFFSLHLIYEEIKLSRLLWPSLVELLDILYLMASDLKKIPFQDYYWRDFPGICSKLNQESRIPENDHKLLNYPMFFSEIPPSIFSFLQSMVKNDSRASLFPVIPEVTTNIHNCLLLFSCLKQTTVDSKELVVDIANPSEEELEVREYLNELKAMQDMKREERLVCLIDRMGMKTSDLKSLPDGVSLILWESIFACRSDPPSEWPWSRLSLVERSDLLATSQNRGFCRKVSCGSDSESGENGLCHLNTEVLRLLFPEDQRVNEAWNMLQSSKPVKVNIPQRTGVNDHDFIEEQERHLYTMCIRTMALSVGRGMMTLRSYKPVVAETFPIPKLCLTGKAGPRNTTVDLSHIETPQNMTTWPLFHNGVAAGLRACPFASDIIDSSWIVYNKPKSTQASAADAQNEHAGFLLGLGLNGHLSKLSTMNMHDYLCRGNELTRVAVILGLAAARRGTMDTAAVKVMSIHVEALLPPTSTELDVPPVVQVAAVMGIGLLYQGSGHSHIAEVLLNEIGRPPGPEMEHYIDRESYALAAGVAFGLVTLGRGNEMMSGSTDGSSIADQLCTYMIGGHKKPLSNVQREKYKTPSYQIREGDYVNADVTSPGATLGLGFLFFDTNNQVVAKWVTAPETQHLLESVRPDFLLLRTLAKGLILWSSVRKTREWVEGHVPAIVSRFAFQRQENFDSRIDYETMSQAFCNIVAGSCFVLGLKYAGSADREAFKVIMGYAKMFLSLPNKPQLADQAGRSTIESCLNVLVLSLALIMAGTGNLEVMKICRYLRARTSQVSVVLYGSHLATHMALGLLFLGGCRCTISTSPFSIAALVISFFPNFPILSSDNRYHLQAFRHLYALAVEPRLLIPRDIDSGKTVYVHLKVLRVKDQEWLQLKSPCLLPQLDSLEKVVLDDSRYWKVTFDRNKNWDSLTSLLDKSGVVSVKKKVACLPHEVDARGYKSIHSQQVMKDALKGSHYQPATVTQFSSDSVVTSFSSLILLPKAKDRKQLVIQQKLCSLLLDCTASETIQSLPAFIRLHRFIQNTEPDLEEEEQERKQLENLTLSQMKLLVTASATCPSIPSHFIETLKSFVSHKVRGSNWKEILKYLTGEASFVEISSDSAQVLVLCDLPPYSSLSPLQERSCSFPDLVSNLRHFSLPISTLILLSENMAKAASEPRL